VRQGSDEELGRIEAGLDADSHGHQPVHA
jgi:hypothetical protein